MARTNVMASEPGDALAGGGGDGYGVLMISDALGAAEVIALEKVRKGLCPSHQPTKDRPETQEWSVQPLRFYLVVRRLCVYRPLAAFTVFGMTTLSLSGGLITYGQSGSQ